MAVKVKAKKYLLTGNEIIVQAALDAGAEMFCGYPITPTTEILTGWAEKAAKDKNLLFLQTEDETSAGFTVIGGVLAGKKAWTATAGPGNILMQDPMSMAEAMRLPTVCYIGQRGGPSTGTVIYSQQEVTLTRFGGNGEGMRIVYSPSTLQELYDLTIKAFEAAWKYRFPTFVLGDGYLGKTLGDVDFHKKPKNYASYPFVQNGEINNLRNTFSIEEELYDNLKDHFKDFTEMSKDVSECEEFMLKDAQTVVFAHGVVGSATKMAVRELREEGYRVGLFRPITLSPFPSKETIRAVKRAKRIVIAESSYGQFGRIVREVLYGVTDIPVHRLYRPAVGIMPEDIVEKVKNISK
ncbi:ferredoxin oxidoreductase [bacterium (Candidatus Howlettbacteria) CG_4_10_14_0_8_um_filter_40_9]|nr:MAG: ferredoxin oxidoreductase [bacterium (Candidatus Howlettbacteria) CG_4_10_14_0_8_um_filter_40_9]